MQNSSIVLTSPINKTPILNNAKNEDNLINIRCCKISRKRVFLPFIAAISLITVDIFESYLYLPLVVFVAFFIIFWNFPWMVYISNTRPLYYEDLFIDNEMLVEERSSSNTLLIKSPNGKNTAEINPVVRQRFERKFLNVLIFTNSLFMAALADYWLYKSNYDNRYGLDDRSENDYYEIIGVTGGILKLFQFLNNTIGSVMLNFIQIQLKKEHQTIMQRVRAEKEQQKKLRLELANISNINHRITDSPPKTQKEGEEASSPIKLSTIVIVRDYENNSDDE